MEGASRDQFEESFIAPPTPTRSNNGPQPNDDNNNVNDDSQSESESLWKALSTPDQITAMLSNFSTSFNVVSISIVLPILETKALYSDDVTAETGSLCASALIAGMIIGQLVGGALGDLIGRRTAMYFVMTLQIFASLGSCLFVGLGMGGYGFFGLNVFHQLAVWRFVCGIGCGGVYPLAASLSSESLQSSSSRSSLAGSGYQGQSLSPQEKVRALKMLAITFSLQGVGFVTVPIVALVLLMICGEDRLDYVWRFILGFGSLPGIILLYLRWKSSRRDRFNHEHEHGEDDLHEVNRDDGDDDRVLDSDDGLEGNASVEIAPRNRNKEEHQSISAESYKPDLWTSIKTEDQLLLKLVGTAGKQNNGYTCMNMRWLCTVLYTTYSHCSLKTRLSKLS